MINYADFAFVLKKRRTFLYKLNSFRCTLKPFTYATLVSTMVTKTERSRSFAILIMVNMIFTIFVFCAIVLATVPMKCPRVK